MKKNGQETTEFVKLLSRKAKDEVKIQTHWATVEDVNWEEKTMTARDTVDDLEFFDVLLGLGSFYRKPKVGAKCLIGIILNQEASAFLIECEAFEEAVWNANQTEITVKEDGIRLKKGDETLKTVLNDMIDELNKIIVVNGRSINVAAMTAIKTRLNQIIIE